MSGYGWRTPELMRNLYPRRLSVEDVEEWRKWSILVAEHRQHSIDVAIRRVLLAISERNSPEDMLVDAVIVWENLFGTNQETVMRVTLALAWLLAENAEERAEKQAAYKKIYELRSGIVHGSRELTKPAELEKPHEALEIALHALRRIFQDRPDLLAEKNSAVRSNRLLLGD
jgi:hypothetical protein